MGQASIFSNCACGLGHRLAACRGYSTRLWGENVPQKWGRRRTREGIEGHDGRGTTEREPGVGHYGNFLGMRQDGADACSPAAERGSGGLDAVPRLEFGPGDGNPGVAGGAAGCFGGLGSGAEPQCRKRKQDGRGGKAMKGQRKFSRRRRLILAAGLLTGFWAVAIPVCWPQNTNANSVGAGRAGYGADSQ